MIEEIIFEKVKLDYQENRNFAYIDYVVNGLACYMRLGKDDKGDWFSDDFFHEQKINNLICPFCNEVDGWKNIKGYGSEWSNGRCHGAVKYEKELLEKLTNDSSIRLHLLMNQITIKLG